MMEVSPVNIPQMTVNPVAWQGEPYRPNDEFGAPFVFDRGTNTVHLAPEGYYHDEIFDLQRGKLQGPTYNGHIDEGTGVIGWYSHPGSRDHETVKDTLSRHVGIPLEEEDSVASFRLGAWEWYGQSVPAGQDVPYCPTCGDKMQGEFQTFCPRCQWSEHLVKQDPLENPPNLVQDMARMSRPLNTSLSKRSKGTPPVKGVTSSQRRWTWAQAVEDSP